jgi:hypothetical protein
MQLLLRGNVCVRLEYRASTVVENIFASECKITVGFSVGYSCKGRVLQVGGISAKIFSPDLPLAAQ